MMTVDFTRRAIMAGGAVAAAGAAMPGAGQVVAGKIDTHHHFLPRVYVDAVGLDDLASVMPNRIAPTWSAAASLAIMEQNGIDRAILSISSGPRIANAPILLRKCNDAGAALRQAHPGRFGGFASLPLPEIAASLKEIAYSLDTLKADGVILFTNYDGKYLGDPLFAPVLDELNRRKAVAFIHPNHPPYALSGLPPEAVLEFPFDTTRTAASLILSGALRRWPDITFILSHAGGTLPYLAQRLAGAVMFDPALAEKIGDPLAAIRRFWFDLALSISKPQLAALMAVADPTRITFGTDFPMVPAVGAAMTSRGLAQAPITDDLRLAIGRGNAARLLKYDLTHTINDCEDGLLASPDVQRSRDTIYSTDGLMVGSAGTSDT